MRALVILLLVQGLVALAQAKNFFGNGGEERRPGNDIRALCLNQPMDLFTFEQLKELNEHAKGEEACSGHIATALSELVALIQAGSSDLCSPDSVEQLVQYYAKYLNTHGIKNYADVVLLPTPLKRFVIAYGMQMSNMCKRNMILVLANLKESNLLNEDDHEMLNMFAGEEGPIADMLGDLAGPGETFLPSDLAPLLKSSGLRTKKLAKDKIYLQTSTGSSIRQLQKVCERRFEPIYAPLMLPLVRLANMGFSFKDHKLKEDLKTERCKHEVAPWSRIVFLCEALKGIELVEEPNDNKPGEEPRMVRIITEEEARNIEAKSGKKKLGHEEYEDEEEVVSALDKVVYEPTARVKLGNVIYDKQDGRFDSAVKDFKTSRSEKKIIRKRLFKKGFSMVKQEIKRGNVGVLLSTGFKGIVQRVKGDKVPETREELITSLDELMSQEDGENSKKVTYKLGHAKTFVISVALVAIFVGLAVAFVVGSIAWLG